jgi:hypothetical protein
MHTCRGGHSPTLKLAGAPPGTTRAYVATCAVAVEFHGRGRRWSGQVDAGIIDAVPHGVDMYAVHQYRRTSPTAG